MSPHSHWRVGFENTPYWWLVPAILASMLAFWMTHGVKNLPTPPGPRITFYGLWKGIAMPPTFQWLTNAEWQGTYGTWPASFPLVVPLIFGVGDIIFLNVLRNPILVINSLEAAQDLLEKRSAIYSSRPIRVMQKDVYVDI
jgi:hypothetical protein